MQGLIGVPERRPVEGTRTDLVRRRSTVHEPGQQVPRREVPARPHAPSPLHPRHKGVVTHRLGFRHIVGLRRDPHQHVLTGEIVALRIPVSVGMLQGEVCYLVESPFEHTIVSGHLEIQRMRQDAEPQCPEPFLSVLVVIDDAIAVLVEPLHELFKDRGAGQAIVRLCVAEERLLHVPQHACRVVVHRLRHEFDEGRILNPPRMPEERCERRPGDAVPPGDVVLLPAHPPFFGVPVEVVPEERRVEPFCGHDISPFDLCYRDMMDELRGPAVLLLEFEPFGHGDGLETVPCAEMIQCNAIQRRPDVSFGNPDGDAFGVVVEVDHVDRIGDVHHEDLLVLHGPDDVCLGPRHPHGLRHDVISVLILHRQIGGGIHLGDPGHMRQFRLVARRCRGGQRVFPRILSRVCGALRRVEADAQVLHRVGDEILCMDLHLRDVDQDAAGIVPAIVGVTGVAAHDRFVQGDLLEVRPAGNRNRPSP
ncbi:MAG: hypothetical protein BWX50_00620 [Euryarchaeota archaeon ADurb.Bin009]|nr:MAG: hypothetical protein BWX50_00620 [Euryarchaeota archaeon ADurb.Bin009]